jgi:hypothetical protein
MATRSEGPSGSAGKRICGVGVPPVSWTVMGWISPALRGRCFLSCSVRDSRAPNGAGRDCTNSKTAIRASALVANLRRSSNWHSSVAKKLSHMALSYASPTEPMDGRTPASLHLSPNAREEILVGMVDHAPRLPLADRRVECIEDEPRPEVRAHGPADHPPRERVQLDGEIEKAGPGRNAGQICHPELVRRFGVEVAINQVARWARTIGADRGSCALAPADAGQTVRHCA